MSSDFDVRHAAPGDCLEGLRLMQALVERRVRVLFLAGFGLLVDVSLRKPVNGD